MPKKDDYGDTSQSETGNWNVASDYAKMKIMNPLEEADTYEKIATSGTIYLMDELNLQPDEIDTLKIQGLKRLVNTLIMLINNSMFAIKPKKKKGETKKGKTESTKISDMSDRELLIFFKKQLKKIKKEVIPKVYSYQINQVNKTKLLKIDVEKYDKVLEYVSEVKAKINEPLNKYDLIFAHREEFDPETAKRQFIENLTGKG